MPGRLAVLPLLAAVAANAALTWVPAMPEPAQFGASGATYWAAVAALAIGALLAAAIGGRAASAGALGAGASAAALPLLGTAVGLGFGASLAAQPDVAVLIDAIAALAAGDPVLAASAKVALFSGAVGLSSGGLALWAEGFAEPALAAGGDPALLHRITALATGVLDTLPHSGAVIALLAICGQRHAEAYGDVFAVSVLAPALGLAVALALV